MSTVRRPCFRSRFVVVRAVGFVFRIVVFIFVVVRIELQSAIVDLRFEACRAKHRGVLIKLMRAAVHCDDIDVDLAELGIGILLVLKELGDPQLLLLSVTVAEIPVPLLDAFEFRGADRVVVAPPGDDDVTAKTLVTCKAFGLARFFIYESFSFQIESYWRRNPISEMPRANRFVACGKRSRWTWRERYDPISLAHRHGSPQ